MSEPVPLTSEERALLDDPRTAPQFASIEFAGRSMEDLVLRDLNFDATSFVGSLVQRVQFQNCRFENIEFNEASFAELRFEGCSFRACRFARAKLHQVNLLECTLEETFWLDAHLIDCALERTSLQNATFQGAELRLRATGGSLEGCTLSRCRVESLLFSDASITNLRLSFCTTERLAFQFCALQRVLLIGGTCEAMLVYAGDLRDLQGAEFQCARLEFDGLTAIETMHLQRCDLARFALNGCARVEDLYVFQSKLHSLFWHGGSVAGWVAESAIGPGSRMEDVRLEDFFLDGSEIRGLTLERVALSRGLCAREARFIGLRLIDLRYEAGLELVLDGASFDDSDLFVRPA